MTEATPEDASDASAAEPTESTGVATDASDSTSATPAEGAALTAASDATADAAAPRKTRLESQLGHYVDRFDQQVSVLQAQAGLTSPESTAKREAALAEIGAVRGQIGEALTEYESLPGADPQVVSWHRDLMNHADQLTGE